MRPIYRPQRGARHLVIVAMALAVVLGAGCSDDTDADAADELADDATATEAIVTADELADIPEGADPASSPSEAVEAMLEADRAGDLDASHALLSPAGRDVAPTPRDWQRRRDSLPDVVDFEVVSTDGSEVQVEVTHDPGLDPFVGLRGPERQTFAAVETAEGWLVDPDPRREFLVPDDSEAGDVAQRWAEAVQGCDIERARTLQVGDDLLGDVTAGGGLCASSLPVVAGEVRRLEPGPSAVTALVEQYSTDVLAWARIVELSGPVDVDVVLAPIDGRWQVLALVA